MSQTVLPHLLDSVTLFLTQYRLSAPMPERHRTVQQIRLLLTKTLQSTLMQGQNSFHEFRVNVDRGLREVEKRCRPGASSDEHDYIDYCVREVSMAVEMADYIFTEHQARPELISILIDDLPIFRPCDYGNKVTESTATVTTPSNTSV